MQGSLESEVRSVALDCGRPVLGVVLKTIEPWDEEGQLPPSLSLSL